MFHLFVSGEYSSLLALCGILFAFVATVAAIAKFGQYLPKDAGRDFAVDGKLSAGKPRGAGIIFVLAFVASALLFAPMTAELSIYLILTVICMVTGFLDDASEKPWGELKKGVLDLCVAILVAMTFLHYNENTIRLALFHHTELVIPKAVYAVLIVVLVWVSVNVTNCADGVDGLCASLCTVTLFAFSVLFSGTLGKYVMAAFLFIAVLFAYLYFNTSPSSMLMGDAGSRALGFFIAVMALKSRHPFSYVLLALVLIVDGGLGLVKIFLKRFFGISILKNTRMPLHDHVRKKFGWSDTQVVVRFLILQVLFAVAAYCFV